MDLDEESGDILLLLLVASDLTNLLGILSTSGRWLVWVKPWLKCRSTKSVYHTVLYQNEN